MTRTTTIIPAYNGEETIAETLQSLKNQTHKPDRIVVLDNCSTDRTESIVRSFSSLNCEWIQHEKNLGALENHNQGLRFAESTDFLHFLHTDDLIEPEFYQMMIGGLENIRGRGLIYCKTGFMDGKGQTIAAQHPTKKRGRTSPIRKSKKGFLKKRGILSPFYFPSAVLKTDRQPIPIRFRLDLPQMSDLVFWTEWALICESFWYIPQILSRYRLETESGNETSLNSKNLQAWVLDEWKAMCLIHQLVHGSEPSSGSSFFLKSVFAARSVMKMRLVERSSPDYSLTISKASKKITGAVCWQIGKSAAGFKFK